MKHQRSIWARFGLVLSMAAIGANASPVWAQAYPNKPIRLIIAFGAGAAVVLLDTGLVLDEHTDYDLGGGRVMSARSWMTPQTNLGVQTRIIAGARAFVGTCGSVAWLAPMLGTPTVGVYADDVFVTIVIEERQIIAGTHRLMLMFGAKDLQLKQWTVTDPQGYDTTIAVYNLDTKKRPDPNLFRIDYTRDIK